jgi:hypothetical protein
MIPTRTQHTAKDCVSDYPVAAFTGRRVQVSHEKSAHYVLDPSRWILRIPFKSQGLQALQHEVDSKKEEVKPHGDCLFGSFARPYLTSLQLPFKFTMGKGNPSKDSTNQPAHLTKQQLVKAQHGIYEDDLVHVTPNTDIDVSFV